MGRPAAGAGLFTEPQPRAWQYPELETGAEEHGQLILRPAAGIPHVCVIQSSGPLRHVINLIIYFSIQCIKHLPLYFPRYVSPLTTSFAGTHRTLRSIGGGALSLDAIRSWLCSKWLR